MQSRQVDQMAAAEHDGSYNLIPQEMVCPITGEIMEDPVITVDGHSYEREAIEEWFSRGRIISPLTGSPLGTTHLTPNHALKKAIAELIEKKLPQLREQERFKPNLETVIRLREEDLRQLKQETVPRSEYDRIVRLLEQTKKEYREQNVLLEKARLCSAQLNTLLQGGTGMLYEGSHGSGGGGGAAEEPPIPLPPATLTGPEQQAHLKKLIGATLYDKLVAKGGIVLDGDENVVEFGVWDKDSNDLLDARERKQLTFDIKHLKSLQNLTYLNLSDTGITGDIVHLKMIQNLTNIYLSATRVTGNIVHLKSLRNLTGIGLGNTNVTGDIVHLKSLKKLTHIGLNATRATGDIVHLKSLQNLTAIHLAYTGVTGDIVHLKSLQNLTRIDLGNTNVTGNIVHLKSLQNLTRIYLGDTGVTGDKKAFEASRKWKYCYL